MGRFGAGGDVDKVAGASDVVVDVVLVVLWKWKNEEIQEIQDFQNRK